MREEGGRNRRGRPKKKQLNAAKEDIASASVRHLEEKARYRNKWKCFVKSIEAMGLQGLQYHYIKTDIKVKRCLP